MRKLLILSFPILIFSILIVVPSSGQESPVAHMQEMAAFEHELSKSYMSYISEVAHGGRARKMERRRQEVIASIKEAIRLGGRVRPYKGDVSLRSAYLEYWGVLNSVFNEEYHKIVDMEEVAERSYDAMEAYLLIQEKANERLDEAQDKVGVAYKEYAAKHNVTLTEGSTSKLEKKLMKVGDVYKYANKIFLIVFKTDVQEGLMIEAMNKGDLGQLEQSRSSLLRFSVEGLSRLDTLKPFRNDGSLLNACRRVLEFRKNEAESKIGTISDFMVRKDDLDKMRKKLESKPAGSRSREEIDEYNKSLADFNKLVATYNKTNNELNTSRTKVLEQWNNSRQRFLDMHIPKS